jgi:hypothetical protein
MNYLGATEETVIPAKLDHDPTYDNLPDDHFVDVTLASDQLKFLTHSLQLSAIRNVREAIRIRQQSSSRVSRPGEVADKGAAMTDLNTVSFALAKWVDGSMHALLLEALSEKDEMKAEHLSSALGPSAPLVGDLWKTVDNIRKTVAKIARRIYIDPNKPLPSCETKQVRGVRVVGNPNQIPLTDPNVAVHSALKNSLIAAACGLVTDWSVESPTPIQGERNLVIQLDRESLTYDKTKVELQTPVGTAFRRDSHTHPVSYRDLDSKETKNGALACLNELDGSARYRATSINTETGLVKEVIIQANNSLAGPSATADSDLFGKFNKERDDRPPQLLRNDQFGTPEPETSGVVFSAPLVDVAVPTNLKHPTPAARMAALPCLFLEDLWTGYRLDVKEETRQKFSSIHEQEQRILFTQSTKTVTGVTEDYIEREQADDPARGHTSTDLTTYNGLSTGQAKDYLVFLGVNQQRTRQPQQPFEVNVVGYSKTERLTFGRVYEYRLRNVFLGGISCGANDPQLEQARFASQYRQRFPFFRARALRPGEVLTSVESQEERDSSGRTIYLTDDAPRALITLVPSPIDIETSRFHGTLFSAKDEVVRHNERKHVGDLGKFFQTIPPDELNYFYDPDVFGVVIRATLVNGDEQGEPQDLIYVDGTYCGISRHLTMKAISETYGRDGDWQNFKPIVISFSATERPSANIRSAGSWHGYRRVDVEIPPAGELHLSIVPLFNPNLLSKTASHIASSAQLAKIGLKVENDASPIPAIAEQTIKVIHAVKLPRQAPVLVCENPRVGAGVPGSENGCLAGRKLDTQFGYIFGRIELDAASTKEVRLEATWSDVNDDPNQERYVLETGSASSTPRSVIFRQFSPVAPAAEQFRKLFLTASDGSRSSGLVDYRIGNTEYDFADQFMLQCAEDKVFMGQPPNTQKEEIPDTSNRINFKDQRRKLLKVQAIAVSRFAERYAEGSAGELRSNSVMVDLPSSVKMTAPNVSHIVPLRKAVLTGDDDIGTRRATFGVRIYLRRQFFQSGFGERLAVACGTGRKPGEDSDETPKDVTQWGEDPIERAGLRSTTRMPRASDFVAPNGEDGMVGLAAELYPELAQGGRAPVIYRDNVGIASSVPAGQRRWVSIASYALRYDNRQRLWYADVYVEGDFFGWCGMALYRHQPNALPDRELSETWDWVYAAVLYGEPVAWVEKQGSLHVTIGPIYDANVAFELDSLEYGDGVSRDVLEPDRLIQPLKSYRVDKAVYFEAVIPKKNFDWSLIKKRFGYSVASTRLRI